MSIIERLVADVLEQAKSNRLTICTAESCSAGRLALVLSKGEGASQHLMGGVVAYTKEMKIRALGVPAELIQRGTAVCADVAEAMARGACRLSGAKLAVSITGVAGPEPDEDGNPVGLIYCSVARPMRRKSLSYVATRKRPTPLSTRRVWKRLSSSAPFVVPSLSLPYVFCSAGSGLSRKKAVHDFVITGPA